MGDWWKRWRKKGDLSIQGRVMVDRRTKRLLARISPGEIAVIDHRDLDEVAAMGLVGAGVAAVVNVSASISGRYPAQGCRLLLEAGIPVLDEVGEQAIQRLADGDEVRIEGKLLRSVQEDWVATGSRLTWQHWREKMAEAHQGFEQTLQPFIENTLNYAYREREWVTQPLSLPPLRQSWRGRDVVVVVRGPGFAEDLYALRTFIREADPFLMAVDGGADALLKYGWTPHLILGDMDSISDQALLQAEELVVHAYSDGRAPGLERVERLGLTAHLLPSPGTSEDVALLAAFEGGAESIVAVGTHSHMVDFLEKGREGMASTLLARIKMGARLVDAKGVSRLYRPRHPAKGVAVLTLASVMPVAAWLWVHPQLFETGRLFWTVLQIWLT
ncbi:putative cytokinetic ring protein SteA [Desmospora activa]|uniref:Putative membrane-anchored protein n=1 Tax=Desmospora activa DSM 45169 TaxID=1121389 RepID=A0A2T4Z9J7_9BACL|nr:putative cytokinetic ring protein SteA [Desmospora activa]PTM58545.1 putative membrane-anchored protein [Desmospora activa DSM 45169]